MTAPTVPTLAGIRDKDDARAQGVVGWRSEYHAMRAALDAVLGVEFRTHVNPWSQDVDHGFAQGQAAAKSDIYAAIAEHIETSEARS